MHSLPASPSYVAARFDLRKSLPAPSVEVDADDESVFSGSFGLRSVGKIRITAYVIAAARPTIPTMYATRSSSPRASSTAA
jgi:hypothetical protein